MNFVTTFTTRHQTSRHLVMTTSKDFVLVFCFSTMFHYRNTDSCIYVKRPRSSHLSCFHLFCDYIIVLYSCEYPPKRNDSPFRYYGNIVEKIDLESYLCRISVEVWTLGLWMTSSCSTRRSYAAVPHSILRDAIGTFHTGKSASSSRGVTLHGNFLVWELRSLLI